MKKITLLIMFMIAANSLKAQAFEEWFQQKKTQKKYLVQQIAALQVYIGYVKKGYSITKKGLALISDFKKGELNLHTDYFNSLQSVNPGIKNYAKVAGIIAYQVKIVQIYNRAYRCLQESNAFSSDELNYIYGVYGRLLEDCSNTTDELITVTTNNQLEMSDAERINRVVGLYDAMQDKYSFIQSFSNEAILLANSRIKENNDIQTSRTINGIKNE